MRVNDSITPIMRRRLLLQLLCSVVFLILPHVDSKDPPACQHGYEIENGVCKDINECYRAIKPCGEHSQCINQAGSYQCKCHQGFVDTTFNGMRCKVDLTFRKRKAKKQHLILGLSGAGAAVLIISIVGCYLRSRQWKKRAQNANKDNWENPYGSDSDDTSDSSS